MIVHWCKVPVDFAKKLLKLSLLFDAESVFEILESWSRTPSNEIPFLANMQSELVNA